MARHFTLRWIACFTLMGGCLLTLTPTWAAEAPATQAARDAMAELDALVGRAEQWLGEEKAAEARSQLAGAMREASKATPDSAVATVLRSNLNSVESLTDDAAAARQLIAGSRVALRLGRLPVAEANLPEGFPAPGPVGVVMVKDYPPYRVARTAASDGAARGDADRRERRQQNSMFRTLFNHIKANDVPMTAPVEMLYTADVEAVEGDEVSAGEPSSMGFMYESTAQGSTGESGRVAVVDTEPTQVVSLAMRGDYSPQNRAEGLAKLHAWLEEQGGSYEVAGSPRWLLYNSPFVPGFLKYSEVQLPIRARQ